MSGLGQRNDDSRNERSHRPILIQREHLRLWWGTQTGLLKLGHAVQSQSGVRAGCRSIARMAWLGMQMAGAKVVLQPHGRGHIAIRKLCCAALQTRAVEAAQFLSGAWRPREVPSVRLPGNCVSLSENCVLTAFRKRSEDFGNTTGVLVGHPRELVLRRPVGVRGVRRLRDGIRAVRPAGGG
jgi:hypothetical protein